MQLFASLVITTSFFGHVLTLEASENAFSSLSAVSTDDSISRAAFASNSQSEDSSFTTAVAPGGGGFSRAIKARTESESIDAAASPGGGGFSRVVRSRMQDTIFNVTSSLEGDDAKSLMG
ncbi:hypothetical protein PWT90_01259 [Aphanocladium album]|nr:hypothetical protein PWT90_01259 [Aphanocladium album]